ncbi:MAG: PAS domain S-box protein [Alphaproteobacteria bacterium]|nr:PAS domain S-box protein [Alphaproteobacteria bacterium]
MADSSTSAPQTAGLDKDFREVLDSIPAMIWLTDAGGRRIWFNKSWLAFTGRRIAEELGTGWLGGVHPEDRARAQTAYTDHFAARQTYRIQYRLRRHDGEYRWIEMAGAPRLAPDGTYLGFIGSGTDVHEAATRLAQEKAVQARIEEDLAQTSRQLQLLIDGIQDYAIYMMDPEGRVMSWNSGAERIKGYSAGEILGRHFSIFYTEEDCAGRKPQEVLAHAALAGKFETESWRVRKDGSRFWAQATVNAIRDTSGALVGFAKITRDVTDRHQAEELLAQARERLLQAKKMEAVGQLTGGVAHDFNNLLMVVIGNLEIARRNTESADPEPVRQRRYLDFALVGARRATTLTQRLLAFSRRQPLNPKPLNVNRFIAGEVEFLQRSLGETVEVEAVGGAGVWTVEADIDQLEAAMLNLAVNARDAMPEGGKLTLETSNAFLDDEYCRVNPEVRPGQYVLISVTDNGTGMTKDVVERAFEPFFTTKGTGAGTGLGLSQVYGFVKQSGGHLKIYSEPDQGTTIRVYLPRQMGDASSEEGEMRPVPTRSEAGETVLVVEDDEDVRSYLAETLKELGYGVLLAHDAKGALDWIGRQDMRIDVLLTDVVLPGPSGRELSHEALALRPGLKVLFMTGYSRNAIVHQGRLDPGVELIQKPFTHEQLAARLRTMLDAK